MDVALILLGIALLIFNMIWNFLLGLGLNLSLQEGSDIVQLRDSNASSFILLCDRRVLEENE